MLPLPHALPYGGRVVVLTLLIAASLFLMYEFGKLVGAKRATDKFPEAKKAAVQRSRSVQPKAWPVRWGNMEPAMNRRVAHRKGMVRCIIKDLPL